MNAEERKEEQSLQQKWPRCLVCARWHDPKKKCPLPKRGDVKAHFEEKSDGTLSL